MARVYIFEKLVEETVTVCFWSFEGTPQTKIWSRDSQSDLPVIFEEFQSLFYTNTDCNQIIFLHLLLILINGYLKIFSFRREHFDWSSYQKQPRMESPERVRGGCIFFFSSHWFNQCSCLCWHVIWINLTMVQSRTLKCRYFVIQVYLIGVSD